MMLAMSGTDCRMTRMIRARGSTAMHKCSRQSALRQSLSGRPSALPNPPFSPLPHLQPSPPLPPGIQTGPFFTPSPSLPEGVGDSHGIEFSNEKPQEQDKDDKEVEDVPAVLGGGGWASPSRVCQAQPVGSSWVCPPHTLRMGDSTVLSEPGQARAIHCSPAVAPPNMPQNTYALAISYTCPQPSAVSEHTVEPLTDASS